jgi:hypothetical protein
MTWRDNVGFVSYTEGRVSRRIWVFGWEFAETLGADIQGS